MLVKKLLCYYILYHGKAVFMKSPEYSIGISADISGISSNFYRTHGGRYAEINKLGLQLIYVEASHAGLKRNRSLMKHLKKLTWGL